MSHLSVEDIHTYYGESHILHGVSLRVAAGEAVAILGRNGAGKTTMIRSIVGFTPPREGRIVYDGEGIHGWPPYRIARRGVALVPQGRRIFAPLSVRENLLLGARAEGWTLERIFALFPRLAERQAPGGGHALGRRAADACARPRAPHQRPHAPAGRAVGRAGADRREGNRPYRAGAEGRSAVHPARRAELSPRACRSRIAST